jgi:hypothetical protein
MSTSGTRLRLRVMATNGVVTTEGGSHRGQVPVPEAPPGRTAHGPMSEWAPVPRHAADPCGRGVNDSDLRALVPRVLGVLVRRGADFATAEDAVQEALIAILDRAGDPPDDPRVWLITVAWRKYLDLVRSDAARRTREAVVDLGPEEEPATAADDTLRLYFLCTHPDLTPSSARGRHRPPGRACSGSTRRVPGAGRDRRAPRRCPSGRGDRLGPHRGDHQIRQAARVHEQLRSGRSDTR